MYHCADYLERILIPKKRKEIVSNLLQLLKDVKFTHIVSSGISSVSISSIIAYEMDKSLIVVRKESDKTHSSFKVEAPETDDDAKFNYVIIDDLKSTGKTIKRMINKTNSSFPNSNPIGVWLYTYENFDDEYPQDDYLHISMVLNGKKKEIRLHGVL